MRRDLKWRGPPAPSERGRPVDTTLKDARSAIQHTLGLVKAYIIEPVIRAPG